MLMQHPDQLQEIKDDPSLLPNFVVELCRYHTGSAMAMKRVAKVDIEIGGKASIKSSVIPDQAADRVQNIRAGEGIIASNQSANRDEEVFPNPDVFDLHRDLSKANELGFGFGPHRCIAELLAKAELEIVFGKCQLIKGEPNMPISN